MWQCETSGEARSKNWEKGGRDLWTVPKVFFVVNNFVTWVSFQEF